MADLSDDIIFRGAILALEELRRVPADPSLYDLYRKSALQWVNEAQARLEDA